MKIKIARKNRAFAVIVALIAVTILTMMAGFFAYSMKVEAKLAANTNDDEEFYWMGRGGIDRACWWLALEAQQPFSSKQQYWNHGPGEGPETNGPLAGESLDNFAIGEGTVSLTMVELESKININTADSHLLQNVLTQLGYDPSSISIISDSVLDWIDPDDNTRPSGAESDYYLGLNPSYMAKNGPIDNMDELTLIKGLIPVPQDNNVPAEATPYTKEKLGLGHTFSQSQPDVKELSKYFTPFSTGKVNILTADDDVLQLLPGVDTAAAGAIETARDSDPPIRNVAQLLSAAGIDPQSAAQLLNYVTIQGSTYEVHARVTIGQISHEYTAIVFRNGATMQVFNFYRSDSGEKDLN